MVGLEDRKKVVQKNIKKPISLQLEPAARVLTNSREEPAAQPVSRRAVSLLRGGKPLLLSAVGGGPDLS